MTKKEAIEAAKKGEKVTHRFFEPEEYITFIGGHMVDEQGYHMREIFWKDQAGKAWEIDWNIWAPKENATNQ